MSFFLLNTKGRYSEHCGKKSSSGTSLTSIVFFFCPTMEVNGAAKQPGYKLSSKYLPLCSAERRHSYRFGTTRGWVNDRIFLCGWTIPVITHHFILILIELDPGWFWENTVAVVTELVCIWLTETARSYIGVDFYFMDISANIYIFLFNWTTLI